MSLQQESQQDMALDFSIGNRHGLSPQSDADQQPDVQRLGGQIFQGKRMTAALLDRLTHHCEIFEMNSESFRFRESMKRAEEVSQADLTADGLPARSQQLSLKQQST